MMMILVIELEGNSSDADGKLRKKQRECSGSIEMKINKSEWLNSEQEKK